MDEGYKEFLEMLETFKLEDDWEVYSEEDEADERMADRDEASELDR